MALLLRMTSWSRAALSFALKLSELLGEDLVAVYVSSSPEETVDGYNALVVVRDPERVEREVVALASEYGISPAVLGERDPEAEGLASALASAPGRWSGDDRRFALKLSELLGEDLVAVYVSSSPEETVDGYNALVVVRDPERVEREVVALASEYGISPAVLGERDPEARSLGRVFRRVL